MKHIKPAHMLLKNLAVDLVKAFGVSAAKASPLSALPCNDDAPLKVILAEEQRKDAKEPKRERTQADLDAIKNAEMKRARKLAKRFNGETPFVLVEIGNDTATRGDSHG